MANMKPRREKETKKGGAKYKVRKDKIKRK
jgi:hypothetical protein